MRFWIDTEFNSYKGALISMALVGSDGAEWYEVVLCDEPIDPWVQEHVIPVLNKFSISYRRMQESLCEFLEGYDTVHIVADWPEDIQHFCEALIIGPGERFNTPPLTMEIRRDLDSASAIPHNALADAHAIRGRHLEIKDSQ